MVKVWLFVFCFLSLAQRGDVGLPHKTADGVGVFPGSKRKNVGKVIKSMPGCLQG